MPVRSTHAARAAPGYAAAMKFSHRDRLPDVPTPPPFPHDPQDAVARGAPVVSYGDERHARGMRALTEFTGEAGAAVVERLRDIAPDFADWIIEFSYGDVMSRPGLDRRSRQLATVAALTALGNAQPQLRVHIEGALNVGCRAQEIVEVILQMAVYAGFPAAINALGVAREVFAQREAH
jgi:4-carboxymuconolactone decarboxylase